MAEASASARSARALLACGAVGGLLFILLLAAQAVLRAGFDPSRHPLSLLSLGAAGWIQTANFIASGLLITASAVGLRRSLREGTGRRWGPALIGIYGVSLIWAGIFPADPALGFPPGTPADAASISWHGLLHNLAPIGMGMAVSLAGFVFARRFARSGQRGWAVCSVAAAVAYLGLGTVAFAVPDFRLMLLGGAAVWTWAAVLCLKIRRDTGASAPARPGVKAAS